MARLPRLNLADIPQHVIQRGNNRQAAFFADEDYAAYLDRLKDYGDRYGVAIHAFVLMTNHVHLLMTPATATGVSQLMQALGRYYVRYINQSYRRTGTLWEGRYKSTLVDEDRYLLTLCRYIELNPVRARMVRHPRDYPWSSYHYNAGGDSAGGEWAGDKATRLITPHACYEALGDSTEARRKAYRALFRRHIPAATLDQIRVNTQKGWVLGNDRFKAEIEKVTGRRAAPTPRGGDRKSKEYRDAAKPVAAR